MITTEWLLGMNKPDLQEVYNIRQAVFCEEQKIDKAAEQDDLDESAIHLLISYQGIPAATGRLLITTDHFVLGRIAVLPKFRGKKLGDLAVRLLIRMAFNMGGERQIVHAQLSVRGFYEKLGFAAIGETYEEAEIPHITMERFGDIFGTCEANNPGGD